MLTWNEDTFWFYVSVKLLIHQGHVVSQSEQNCFSKYSPHTQTLSFVLFFKIKYMFNRGCNLDFFFSASVCFHGESYYQGSINKGCFPKLRQQIDLFGFRKKNKCQSSPVYTQLFHRFLGYFNYNSTPYPLTVKYRWTA